MKHKYTSSLFRLCYVLQRGKTQTHTRAHTTHSFV
uniref:Uncharacterized protein n=1 Tax=Anguilla anguilla TaxID=7936 RepID=A0A0E9U7W3_ANGAN